MKNILVLGVLMGWISLGNALRLHAEECVMEGVPKVKPAAIAGSPYSVEVCQKPDDTRKKLYSSSEIRVMKQGRVETSYLHIAGATGGYVSEIDVKMLSPRWLAVGYDSDEFCNSIVFFDLEKKRTAGHLGCVDDGYVCRAVALSGPSDCTASVACRDHGAEGHPPSMSRLNKTVPLCQSTGPIETDTSYQAMPPNSWNNFWGHFLSAIQRRDQKALKAMMSKNFVFGEVGEGLETPQQAFAHWDEYEGWKHLADVTAKGSADSKCKSDYKGKVKVSPPEAARCDSSDWFATFEQGADGKWRFVDLVSGMGD